MSKFTWLNSDSGAWTDGTNWSGGAVPAANGEVVINAGATTATQYAVIIDSTVTVNSITLNSPGAVLQLGTLDQGASLQAAQLALTSGTLAMGDSTLSGTITAGRFGSFKFVYGYYSAGNATLDNVTWHGDFAPVLTGVNSQFLAIEGGLTLAGANGTGAGAADLQNGASLDFLGSQTLDNATISLGGTYVTMGNACEILSSATASQTASLVLGANLIIDTTGAAILQSDGALTNLGIINARSVVGHPALLIQGGGTFENDGVINDTGVLVENVGDFINAGTLNVSGGTLTLTQSATSTWSNSGVIAATGGTVLFAGTITAAQLGTFETANGGKLGLAGTLLNTGTLVLGAGGLPSLILATGGVIDGGTIEGGQNLAFAGGGLQDVDWLGNLSLTGDSQSLAIDGITFVAQPGTATTLKIGSSAQYSSDTLAFTASQTLQNTPILLGNAANAYGATATLETGPAATLTLGGSTTLSLASGAAIVGDALVNGGVIEGATAGTVTVSLNSLENDGTMDFTSANTNTSQGFTADIQAGSFVNTGTIDVGGGTTLAFAPLEPWDTAPEFWTSSGAIVVGDATLLLGGTLTTASLDTVQESQASTVMLAGVLQNAGQLLSVGGSGLSGLDVSGTVIGGTLAAQGGALQYEGGTLSGVTSTNGITLAASGESVSIADSLKLAGASRQTLSITGQGASIDFLGTQTIANAVVDLGAAAASAGLDVGNTEAAAALTLAHGSTLAQVAQSAFLLAAAAAGTIASFTNDGNIQANVAAGSLTVSNLAFLNSGTFTIKNAEKVTTESGSFANTGLLAISGPGSTLLLGPDAGETAFTNTGTIDITNGALDVGTPGGGIPSLKGLFSNTGTLNIAHGVLGLDVSLTTAELGAVTVTKNGSIQLQGLLDNTSSILNVGIGTALHEISLDRGTLLGGTVTNHGGGIGFQSGTLSAITYDGALALSHAHDTLTVTDGLTLHAVNGSGNGTIGLTGADTMLSFAGSTAQTLDKTQITFGATGDLDSQSQLTLGRHLTFRDLGTATFSGLGTMTSLANIAAATSGDTLTLGVGTFINAGTLAVSNGESGVFSGQVLTNNGVITLGANSSFALATLADDLHSSPTLTNAGSIILAGGSLTILGNGNPDPTSLVVNAVGAAIAGTGFIQAAIANDGTITAQGGILGVDKIIEGTGALFVDGGATLMLGHVSAGQTASFEGVGGVLSLAPPGFLGAIGNFASGDVIDLQNTSATAASFGGDSLRVTLSTGSTIALSTTSTFTGSLTVTAGDHSDSLISFAAAAQRVELGVPDRFTTAAMASYLTSPGPHALLWPTTH